MTNLNALSALLAPGREWCRLTADTQARTATVHVYGAIGDDFWWDDVSSTDLVPQLDALDVDEITVYVNSPGGFTKDGLAIMNALRRNSAKVTAVVDGLAASAATIVMLGADEVAMGAGTQLMIHDAWIIAVGSAEDLRHTADRIDKTSQTVAGLYAQRAGGTVDQWREAMLAETWYSAEEAVQAGLADRVITLTTDDDADQSRSAVSVLDAARAFGWRHSGRAAAGRPFIPRSRAAAAHLSHREKKEEPTMSDQFNQGVRDRLGLPADATEETMLASLDERLTVQPAAAALPEGVVTIEETTLTELRSDAAAGREARTEQLRAAREHAVDAAINDGRIAPARRDHWLSALTADAGALETLNGLQPGLVPLQEKGHSDSPETAEAALMSAAGWGDDEKETSR